MWIYWTELSQLNVLIFSQKHKLLINKLRENLWRAAAKKPEISVVWLEKMLEMSKHREVDPLKK